MGHQVGDVARRLYDRMGAGDLIDPHTEGFDVAIARTQTLLTGKRPIFEATLRAEGALALADVMLPDRWKGKHGWRMIEVKSATSVKDYHKDDAAIQAFVSRSAGVPLTRIAVAHIDSAWVYGGGEDYDGLLKEVDVTQEASDRHSEVGQWVAEAQRIAARRTAPKSSTGAQCVDPYECGFLAHCQSQEPQAQFPIHWIPRRSKSLSEHLDTHRITEIRDVPDHLLNLMQQRVKKATLSGKQHFDQAASARELSRHGLPAYFLDFETVQFAVPIWKGTRPYQQLPFQFSLHRLSRTGKLTTRAFLDLSGNDPSKAFAQALIDGCGEREPIFVYNAAFEKTRIRELAERFPRMAKPLLALNERIVDLLPIARDHYYHPSQEGSWSIKAVLPALCPELSYEHLEGIQDGGAAMEAFLEALSPDTSPARKVEIERQLLAYCAMDTYAMVRMWAAFTGTTLGN